MNDNFITITKERYMQMARAELFLQLLHCNGLDSWEGYEIALNNFTEVTEHLSNAD